MEKTKVVYIHRKATNGEIFYVGIGSKYRSKEKEGRNRFWKNTVKKYGYTIHIVERNLSWKEACESEIALIELIGRRDKRKGSLVNLTDGGEGGNGHISTRRINVINLNTGEIYHSIIEAAKTINLRPNHLVNCVNGKDSRKRASHLRALNSDNEIQWKSEDDEGFKHKEFEYRKGDWVELLAYDLGCVDALNGVSKRGSGVTNKVVKENRLRDYIKKIML